MWTINRTNEFFERGILSRTGSVKNSSTLLELMVEVVMISGHFKIFIRHFKFNKFEWMDNALRDCSSHQTSEFCTSYVATLINLVATTETTKRWQMEFATALGLFDSIVVMGKSIDLLETSIKRMLHGPSYIALKSLGVFEAKH